MSVSAHRKVVTVLFCDVVGSTALGESVDPEALQGLLARYFERMKAIVERHGGSVEKFIGDAVMAVFGVPVVHEDDALRAVRAALEMRVLFPELGVEGRIGITTGEVVTGTEERLATGDAVNVAARLEQAAQPGEILIGEETLRLARDAVEVQPVEPLELKGKADPVEAHRLLSLRSEALAIERHLQAPMVGRSDELDLLTRAYERSIRERACHLFTILGPAGEGTCLDLVAHVAGRCRAAPILLLCMARPDLLGRRTGWGGGKVNARVVLLEALAPEETERLVDSLGTLDGALRAGISQAAE